MLKKTKTAALIMAAAGLLPVLGCLGSLPIDWVADWLIIIEHFEGQF